MRASLLALFLLLASTFAACGESANAPDGTATSGPSPGATAGETSRESVELQEETIVTGLEAPWALAFAPDGRMFITERPGRLRVVEDGVLREEPVAVIDDVAAVGESGLLGLTLDPDFASTGLLYMYYTYQSGSELRNRVVRYVVQGNELLEESREVLIEGIPGGAIHNGGRIAFGPDGLLYITTGEAAQAPLAQDTGSLAGKILRVNPDGTIPADNPFPGSPVYSYGHRNPQGLAWQPGTGRLYATEHGPSANDEVNLIEPGQNYGWPDVQGAGQGPPFRAPVAVYETTIAPSGATFYDSNAIPQWRDSLFFAGLRGTHLHRIELDPDAPDGIADEEELYSGAYGRLRDVVQGPDGALYVATSNRDGRGNPSADDDRIVRISAR